MKSTRPRWFLPIVCALAAFTCACAGTDMHVNDSLPLSGIQVLATPGGVGPLSPPFSPDITRYAITADSDISEIEIIATIGVPAAHRIRVAGAIVSSGTATAVALKPWRMPSRR
jgi:hypothetical protein